ncbi:MAG: ankyrin repeat domain-containing protein [Candidatus Rokubacteria bacterium]|nr:ankyrin repeat domain-containing protein [Candidatus Rokubacteria bacterium]
MDRVLVAVVALLLAGCASASKPLAQAALNGDTATVQALLAQGARVNGRGPAGITPLMLAAQRGHTETVGALLEAKADVNASRGKPSSTPPGAATPRS